MKNLTTVRNLICRFAACESGATAIEYAMIAGGVGAVVAVSVQSLGTGLKTTLYDKLASIMP